MLVFALDFMGATGSNEVVGEIGLERPFIQAGYTSEDHLLRMADVGEFAAIGLYVPVRLIRKAVSLAVLLALKKDVPKSVEIPIEIHESAANTGAPQTQAQAKSKMRSRPPTP